ncbi:MAG: hypothetical protein LBO66_10020 [Deltaproteobacteria bacterium]|nr:hypothetical protein [Deltaproteobacteria bacterium]
MTHDLSGLGSLPRASILRLLGDYLRDIMEPTGKGYAGKGEFTLFEVSATARPGSWPRLMTVVPRTAWCFPASLLAESSEGATF